MSTWLSRMGFVLLGWLALTPAAIAQNNQNMPLADVWITPDRPTPYMRDSGEAAGPMTQTGDTWLTDGDRNSQPPPPARQETASTDAVRTGSAK
jgi:hypothetical protein